MGEAIWEVQETNVSRKTNWVGLVMRGDGLLREVMEGRMEGKSSVWVSNQTEHITFIYSVGSV